MEQTNEGSDLERKGKNIIPLTTNQGKIIFKFYYESREWQYLSLSQRKYVFNGTLPLSSFIDNICYSFICRGKKT